MRKQECVVESIKQSLLFLNDLQETVQVTKTFCTADQLLYDNAIKRQGKNHYANLPNKMQTKQQLQQVDRPNTTLNLVRDKQSNNLKKLTNHGTMTSPTQRNVQTQMKPRSNQKHTSNYDDHSKLTVLNMQFDNDFQ